MHCLCLEKLNSTDSNSSPKQVQQVRSKGLTTLINITHERSSESLSKYLEGIEVSGENLYVHFDCRRKYTDARRRVSNSPVKIRKKLRTIEPFDWKSCCFFCCVSLDTKHKDINGKWRRVMTLELKENILKRAADRQDTCGIEVSSRLESCNDLVAEEQSTIKIACHCL